MRLALAVFAVLQVECFQVHLLDGIEDEPDEVCGWQPFLQAGRQEIDLFAVAFNEIAGRRGPPSSLNGPYTTLCLLP